MAFVDFRYVLSQWQSIGVFDIILPMILLFTIIFAILKKTKILGGLPGIDVIVSLVISFIAIINPEVSTFFLSIFSNLGLGIIVLLSVMLLLGFAMGGKKKGMYWLGILGAIAVFIWIMSRVFTIYGGYYYPDWFTDNLIWIIPLALAVVGIIAVVSGQKEHHGLGGLMKEFFEKVED